LFVSSKFLTDIYRCRIKCHAKWSIGTFICYSGDTNESKLSAMEQLYARIFHLRSCRKFDEADTLQSLVDSLCIGM